MTPRHPWLKLGDRLAHRFHHSLGVVQAIGPYENVQRERREPDLAAFPSCPALLGASSGLALRSRPGLGFTLRPGRPLWVKALWEVGVTGRTIPLLKSLRRDLALD